MIRTRESLVMFSLLAVFAGWSSAGTEPNDANAPLTFELSPTVLPAPSFRPMRYMKSPWKGTVTYAAGVPYNRSEFFPRHGSGNAHSLLQFVQSQDISEEQRRFLATTDGGLEASHAGGQYNLPDFYTPPADPNAPQFLLYAVSEADARKMAEAFLQFARNRFNERVARQRAEVNGLAEKLTSGQQRLPELTQAGETTKQALEEVQKQVPYRDEKQALDAAAELDKMLNAAQVDIAGIQATLKAIQDYRNTRPGSQATNTRLDEMFVEESIALQAAEARKQMATTLRQQADRYLDLIQARQRIAAEKEQLAKDLPAWSQQIENARLTLGYLMEREPRVINNKVFIYPVGSKN